MRNGLVFFRLIAVALLAAAVTLPALAEKRVALVIGNAAYKHAPGLANPRNDAEGVAASLKRLNFEVIAGLDLDEAATRRLLREFAEKLEGLGKDDVAVLFYAGHGLQVNGRNYLVPVDAKLEKERDLDFQAVSFEFVQSLMEKTPQTNILILDSCRDNPLARTLARGMGTRSTGIGRGLAEMRGINDTLIVYATSPGNVALDGATKHSPFTEALLKHIEAPGLEVRHMVSQVRAAVIAATKGQQVPWESASLTRQVYFAAAPATRETPAPAPAAPAPPPTADGDIVFWQSIQNSKSAADYKAYLEKYPNGTFAALAKLRIAESEKAADVTPQAPEKPPQPPVSPRRTSTLQHGFTYSNAPTNVLGKPRSDVVNAQACAERCIQTPQCAAWTFWNKLPQCYLLRAAHQGIPHSDFTAGMIRTTSSPAGTDPGQRTPEPTTRTSSYEPDVGYDLRMSLGSTRVANARECQATCLKVPYCTAWSWFSSGSCGLYSDTSPKRMQTSGAVPGGIVTGVVRGPRPSHAPDATSPQGRQGLIRELMRKAAAREGDFTFCERTGWEPLSRKTFDPVWPSGGLVTFVNDHSKDCIVAQMASGLHEGVRVLRLAKMWFCGRRASCNAAEGEGETWCRTSAGGYLPVIRGQPIPDDCRKQ